MNQHEVDELQSYVIFGMRNAAVQKYNPICKASQTSIRLKIMHVYKCSSTCIYTSRHKFFLITTIVAKT